ncbi:hypothetical protein NQ314_017693 [Rhamnusium bicolor]|uniref:HTH psq-type domain-containing protein n=1 Tax=Rhamnusium bicolor TaxID=1586634 RepID=A0AAV8WTU5_9CUCU|nr:hypothetical protein NQ314_017693 [Rhamnusium bicolor]
MPKVKSGLKYKKRYDENNIQQALAAISDGSMSKKQAGILFGVPRSTLQFRGSDKFKKITCGLQTILTKEEEDALICWIQTCQEKGFPGRKDVHAAVKGILDSIPRKKTFKNNYPGTGRYNAFLRRNSKLITRTSEGDGDRIYNGDETNFQLCPKNNRLLAPRGAKNVYEVDQAQPKSTLTVMFSFSASVKSVPDDWSIGKSDTGWMKAEVFYEYVGYIFYPFLVKNNVKFPVIYFLDGHKTHLTYNLSKLRTELQIVLVAIYPNATGILQPADVAAFRPIKSDWRKSVLD